MKPSQLLSVSMLMGLMGGCGGLPPAEPGATVPIPVGTKPTVPPREIGPGDEPSHVAQQRSDRLKSAIESDPHKLPDTTASRTNTPVKQDASAVPGTTHEARLAPPGMSPAPANSLGSSEDRVALVNGQPITRRELVERLLLSEGPKLLDLMIETELARQMSLRGGATLDAADREQFLLSTLRAKYRQEGRADMASLPDDQLRIVWAKALERHDRLTSELAMERIYCLDRLARLNLTVSDAELREEFERTFGEKVRFRCIMVENRSEASELLKRLQQGDDFAETAKRVSRYPNAANGGLCDPVAVSLMPENIRATMARLKPLELTPPVVLEGKWFIFQLLDRSPAQSVEYRQVVDQLRTAVEEKKVQATIKRLLLEIQKAKLEVTYYDDRLRMTGENR